MLNGTAVLEAIFLPASKAGQYPRIASSGEVTLEWEQPAVPGRRQCQFRCRTGTRDPARLSSLVPRLPRVSLAAGVLPALVGPTVTAPAPARSPTWQGGGLCSSAEHHPPQEVGWGWHGAMHVMENCGVGSISSSATNFLFSVLEQTTQTPSPLSCPYAEWG